MKKLAFKPVSIFISIAYCMTFCWCAVNFLSIVKVVLLSTHQSMDCSNLMCIAASRGIIAIREQHLRPEAFGRSDFYIVCLMKPLTHDIHACAVEVDVCKWHKLEDAYKDGESSPLTKRVLDLVRYGLLHGWSSVLMASYDVPTLFGTKANVYHRHLTGIQPSTK